MLQLTEKGLENRQEWLEKGYLLPGFNRAKMIAATEKSPVWVHFGAGNIFRAFQCAAMQKLLDAGKAEDSFFDAHSGDIEELQELAYIEQEIRNGRICTNVPGISGESDEWDKTDEWDEPDGEDANGGIDDS